MPHGTFGPRSARSAGLQGAVCVGLAMLGGCVFMPTETSTAPAAVPVVRGPDPAAPRLPPLETRHVALATPAQDVIGETQVLFTHYEDTFSAIGRQYNLGYEELRQANPTVDQWLPGEATPVYLPTQTILPDAPREGIVVNVPAMRLFYFTTETGTVEKGATAKSAADPAVKVTKVSTHPIGIGAEGWGTPIGEATVTQKARDPVWYVPASVRKEHAERGDPLPRIVQPGPDNPLGKFAMALSIPGYLIHGTNKPAGVGMRSSHGCVRLYPEDIEALFERVARGTRVRFVNQPVLAGWRDGTLYLEVHPALAEESRDLGAEAEAALAAALKRAGTAAPAVEIDAAAVQRIVAERRGIPFPVQRTGRTLEQYLAAARIVENTVPVEQTARNADVEQPAAAAARAPTSSSP
jgi:L,D-transpeptidase ErfK/SrfK